MCLQPNIFLTQGIWQLKSKIHSRMQPPKTIVYVCVGICVYLEKQILDVFMWKCAQTNSRFYYM